MRKLILLVGVSAMAFAAPLFAQGHGGQGGHGGKSGQGDAPHGQKGGSHGGGGQHGQGGARHAETQHGQGGSRHAEAQHGQGGGAGRAEHRGGQHETARLEHPGKSGHGPDQHWASGRSELHGRQAVGHVRVLGRPAERRFENHVDWRRPGFNWASVRVACPPGLAKKGNGCLPPGQARKWFAPGQRFVTAGYPSDRDLYGYYDWFGFRPYTVPARYGGFYNDAPGYYYQSYGGNIYRVATGTDLVLGLIPGLGGGFAVGQPLPIGYNVYNVPYGYRSAYYDQPDVSYRYGDHAIYAVDPTTRLVESIAALVTGDVAVGRPLPVGYDAYNVPFAYRDRYYDSDTHLYRYSDGYIYSVEPRTRVVETAILV